MNAHPKHFLSAATLLSTTLLFACGGGSDNPPPNTTEGDDDPLSPVTVSAAGAIYQGTYTNSPAQQTIAYLSKGEIRRPPEWRKSDWPVSAGTIIITETTAFHGPPIEDVGRVAEFGLSLTIDGYDLLVDQLAPEINCDGVWDGIDVGDTSDSLLNVDEIEVRNPSYNQDCTVDIEIDHPDYGWIPFTASPYDGAAHGREFFIRAIDGQYGDITPYTGEDILYQMASPVFQKTSPSLRFDLDFAAASLSGGDGQRALDLIYDSSLSEKTSLIEDFEGVWFSQSDNGASLSMTISNSQIDGTDSNSCTYFGWIRPIELDGSPVDGPFHGVRLAIDNCNSSDPQAPSLSGDYHGLAIASKNSLSIALRPGGATYRLSSTGAEIEQINPTSIYLTLDK